MVECRYKPYRGKVLYVVSDGMPEISAGRHEWFGGRRGVANFVVCHTRRHADAQYRRLKRATRQMHQRRWGIGWCRVEAENEAPAGLHPAGFDPSREPHQHSDMCIRWDQSGYVCPQLEEEDRQASHGSGTVAVSREVIAQAVHDYEMEWGWSPRPDAWPNVFRRLLGLPSGADLNAR